MSEIVQTTVVGAGVVGCAVAWRLASAGHQVLVLEKSPGATQGENQSSRNSGVIHAGLYYDQATRPLKARLCAQGNALLYEFCQQYQVPALGTGKLVVATREEDRQVLEVLEERARQNQVPVSWLEQGQVAELEPRLRTRGALSLPSSGVVDAAALVHKLYALASNQGAIFMFDCALTAVQARAEGLELEMQYRDGARERFLTQRLVNCAGLYSDQVAALVDPASPFSIDPVRSESARFYRTKRPELDLTGFNVYATPRRIDTPQGSYYSVGAHLSPILETDPQGDPVVGPAVLVGPLSRAAQGPEDYGEPYLPPSAYHAQISTFFPALREEDIEYQQTGIQARLVGHQDWVIQTSPASSRCLNLLGIDSPGLTGSLAIAGLVASLITDSASPHIP